MVQVSEETDDVDVETVLMMLDCSRGRCPKYFSDVYTPLLLVRDCDQPTTVTSSSHAHGPLGLAAAVSACADQQFATNFH